MSKKFSQIYRTIIGHFYVLRLTLLVVLFQGFISAATAESKHRVAIPLSIHTETQVIKTSACLELFESDVSSSENNSDPGLERLYSVFNAIKSKDHDALLRLSDPKLGGNSKQFEEQATAYFVQFDKAELVGVSHVYELDGLIVYLARIETGRNAVAVPFVFSRGGSRNLGFLPYRTDLISYKLLEDWIYAAWGPGSTKTPSYCDPEKASNAGYRVTITTPKAAAATDDPSYVLVSGTRISDAGNPASPSSQITKTFGEIDASLRNDDLDSFLKVLPESVVKRIRSFYSDASQEDRDEFRRTIEQQRPFFVFDASPLLVTYTKSPSGDVQVMYFLLEAGDRLVWINAYNVTLIDQVFKKGVFYEASQSQVPFSKLASNAPAKN